jgi:hypothetical protein
MKRYVCTVATGFLLALVSTGSAAAGLPILGNTQQGSQSTSFGDQSVGEQKNQADVNQEQGNGNVNVSPAIAIFGDATTWNAQGNGNVARVDVDQANEVTQSQSATQNQSLGQSGGGCCNPRGGSKPPKGGCKPAPQGGLKSHSASCTREPWSGCRPPKDGQLTVHGGNPSCMPVTRHEGQSQTGSQSAVFGDQTVGEQKNEADVNQAQGNKNANVSPALGKSGKKQHRSCGGRAKKGKPRHGGAATWNAQGNGNAAHTDVDQGNTADQSQASRQGQTLNQSREEVSLL